MIETIVFPFGPPGVVMSDEIAWFDVKLLKYYLKKNRCKRRNVLAYDRMSIQRAEIVIETLKHAVWTLKSDDRLKLYTAVNNFGFGYLHASLHDSFSPFQLSHGVNIRYFLSEKICKFFMCDDSFRKMKDLANADVRGKSVMFIKQLFSGESSTAKRIEVEIFGLARKPCFTAMKPPPSWPKLRWAVMYHRGKPWMVQTQFKYWPSNASRSSFL